MAKIDINFNDTKYSLDENALAEATAELKSHLSSTMSGEGATINFDGISYSIDSAKLDAAKNDLISHLGTVAGSGVKVTVGGVEYGVDASKVAGAVTEIEAVLGGLNNPDTPAPDAEVLEGDGQTFYKLVPSNLQFRSSANLSDFKEVKINGQTIDESYYTLEEGSTIVILNTDYLQTLNSGEYEISVVSEGSEPSAKFNVYEPECNEYKLYFSQPYVGDVYGLGEVTAFFHKNNTVELLVDGNPYQTVDTECVGNVINIPALEATGLINDYGTEISLPDFGATLMLVQNQNNGKLNKHGLYYNVAYVGGELGDEAFVFFEDDATGYYNAGVLYQMRWHTEYSDGEFYMVTPNIRGYISDDGKEISVPDLGTYVLSDNYLYESRQIGIGDYIYRYSVSANGWRVEVNNKTRNSYGKIKSNFMGAPVNSMFSTFYGCTSLTTAPVIPDSVTNMSSTFRGCTSLTTAPVIPDSVTNMNSTFRGCISLTGTITINADLAIQHNQSKCQNCFTGTVLPIVLTGSSVELSSFVLTATNGNITIA